MKVGSAKARLPLPLPVAVAALAALALTVSLAVGVRGLLPDPTGLAGGTNEQAVSSSYGKLPLAFVPNRGQTDPRVRYHAQGPGFNFYFSDEKITLGFPREGRGTALELRFVGASPSPRLVAQQPAEGRVNYLIGSRRHSNLPTYGTLRYHELWPGIDMVIRGTGGTLKYEFRLAPGANPSDIRLAYAGADSLSMSAAGNLLIGTPLGTLRDSRPFAYQPAGGRKAHVDSRYSLGHGARHAYGFDLGAYDPSRPLVIDPGLDYSTFLGGSGTDVRPRIAVDSGGNAYIAGSTSVSTFDFPTTPGAYDTTAGGGDAYVTKLNPTGTALVYSTFIGGEVPIDPQNGDNSDNSRDIAVDAQGNAYIMGGSQALDFPVTPGAYRTSPGGANGENFVAKLNAAGNGLVYATFIGYGDTGVTSKGSIAVDALGNAHVTGATSSSAFPTTPGAYDTTHNGNTDAYVVKLNPGGSAALYSTYLGGSGFDESEEVALDSGGSAYLTGMSNNSTFPTTDGAYDRTHAGNEDVFVAKLNANGGLTYSTFLGGAALDRGTGLAVDSAGSAYVTGETSSNTFPTTPGVYATTPDLGFVTKLSPAGSALEYSTYFEGETGTLSDPKVALDNQRNAYITGVVQTTTMVTTPNAYDPSHNGNWDAFVAKLDEFGAALEYSSYLGGSLRDWGSDIAVRQARAYVVGKTYSSEFPTTEGAFDRVHSDGSQFATAVFVSKLDPTIYGYARPQSATPTTIRLVPAYKSCTSPNGSHGAPLSSASCNPVQQSDFLTVGSPDSNGKAANSVGLLGLKAVGESPINVTNGDQSDVEISFLLTDVRRKSDLLDYLGEVKVVLPIRITDRYNATSLVHPGTVTDTTFSFISNCVPTSDTSTGSVCSTNTTADALMAGVMRERKRAIWELGQVQVFDGGSDGDAGDADNTLFAVQGLFAP